MNWLTGGKQGEAKRLIAQLSDSTKRDIAAKELIKLGAEEANLAELKKKRDEYEKLLADTKSESDRRRQSIPHFGTRRSLPPAVAL